MGVNYKISWETSQRNASVRSPVDLCAHLSLNVVNGATLGVAVGAIILVVHFFYGTINFLLDLEMD